MKRNTQLGGGGQPIFCIEGGGGQPPIPLIGGGGQPPLL